jgi:hypothetical protein
MLDTHHLSLKEVDLALCHASDYYKEGLALVPVDISCVGLSLSYAVVALCTRLEQQEFCHKYTW